MPWTILVSEQQTDVKLRSWIGDNNSHCSFWRILRDALQLVLVIISQFRVIGPTANEPQMGEATSFKNLVEVSPEIISMWMCDEICDTPPQSIVLPSQKLSYDWWLKTHHHHSVQACLGNPNGTLWKFGLCWLGMLFKHRAVNVLPLSRFFHESWVVFWNEHLFCLNDLLICLLSSFSICGSCL